jgi:hypothetical protein
VTRYERFILYLTSIIVIFTVCFVIHHTRNKEYSTYVDVAKELKEGRYRDSVLVESNLVIWDRLNNQAKWLKTLIQTDSLFTEELNMKNASKK